MKTGAKTMILSMAALCVCTVLVIGGTFALFTDKAEMNNHLKAGNLDVGLECPTYTEYVLDDTTGTMVEREVDIGDLTELPDKLFKAENAVPGSWYKATIKVSNHGTTAFDYDVKILWDNDQATIADKVFAEQMEITIEGGNLTTPKVFKLSDAAKSENTVSLGSILKGAQAQSFTVTATFLNDDRNNNDAMNATLDFDVQVSAIQKTN